MKRSEAARYAKWSAVAALCLALITSGIYLRRQYVAHVEQRNAPPAPPTGVERQSSALTVSRGEADRTVFTVSASKSTDFKGQDISLLEDVKITVFGKTGDRLDIVPDPEDGNLPQHVQRDPTSLRISRHCAPMDA